MRIGEWGRKCLVDIAKRLRFASSQQNSNVFEPQQSKDCIMNASVYKYKYSVLGLARWETQNIAEWVAYYKYLGFDHIYLYCNDDDPGDLYTQISPYVDGLDPYVTFVHYPYQGHQWWMWMHFFKNYKDETEWVGIFDVDEFLNLPEDRSIVKFMQNRSEIADCIYFYWTFFGTNGYEEQPIGSVLRNYTRRQDGLDANTKTLTRTACIDHGRLRHEMRHEAGFVYPNHGWRPLTSSPMRMIDVLGNDMSGYYEDFPTQFQKITSSKENIDRIFRTGVLHHYAFKAKSHFMRRVQRGTRGSHSAQTIWQQQFESGDYKGFLDNINAYEDNSLKNIWSEYLHKVNDQRLMISSPKEELISLGKNALQSSIWPVDANANLEDAAAKAVNGDHTGSCNVHTDFEPNPWWQVDLGASYTISEIRIYNRVDVSSLMARNRFFTLSVSSDGKTWSAAYRRESEIPFGGIDGNYFTWRPDGQVVAKWVRVSLDYNEALNLDQVEIYGKPESQSA